MRALFEQVRNGAVDIESALTRMRHMPFVIGQLEREHWLTAMIAAMEEVEIPEPAYSEMRDYFEKTSTFLMNTPLLP